MIAHNRERNRERAKQKLVMSVNSEINVKVFKLSTESLLRFTSETSNHRPHARDLHTLIDAIE